jgi:NAD(P)-dependent dehydrogenase (short-subunit alcohol dehydrogenase family)
MPGRLAGRTAVVVGAGQTPGETIGNGRAAAILFAREGATVMCVDRRLDSAAETVAMIDAEGGQASAYEADVAYAALFLASDEAKFITGAILPVDGGMAAGVG